MGHQQHKQAGEQISARCAVVTLSDTRTEATDTSGLAIRTHVLSAGHLVTDYAIIPDDVLVFDPRLRALIDRSDIDVIFTNGGTGISRRDQTVDVVAKYLTQPLPGFGELFRMLSWEQIGSSAMLSRAIGGIAQCKIVFAMPGSTKAVELAMTRLILPELGHLLSELRK